MFRTSYKYSLRQFECDTSSMEGLRTACRTSSQTSLKSVGHSNCGAIDSWSMQSAHNVVLMDCSWSVVPTGMYSITDQHDEQWKPMMRGQPPLLLYKGHFTMLISHSNTILPTSLQWLIPMCPLFGGSTTTH